MNTLTKNNSELSSTKFQLDLLNKKEIEKFDQKLEKQNLPLLKPTQISTFQINIGKKCNMLCKHCHVDGGPDRTEVMSKETMLYFLKVLDKSEINTVDITGGAPELNPHFSWFIEQLYEREKRIITRTNLTVLTSNPKFFNLPFLFKECGVEIVCSLPYFKQNRVDKQRGQGTFAKSLQAIKLLNSAGYGMENSGLKLDVMYNPTGAFLPTSQASIEKEFRHYLLNDYNVYFNNLLIITNTPINRFLDFLVKSDNFDGYMETLYDAFNPQAVESVMCRSTLSIGWDGFLYDCDFNQMLELNIKNKDNQRVHLKDLDLTQLSNRKIITNQHCYACTAVAGYSCGGEVVS